MPLDRRAPAPPLEVIEILSDSDDDDDDDDKLEELLRPTPTPPAADAVLDPFPPDFAPAFADPVDDAEWAAVFAALDAEEPAHAGVVTPDPPPARQNAAAPITEDQCLARVLEIYPDIAHDHVLSMFREGLELGMHADTTWCDQMIVRILDEGKYPKERDAKLQSLKRKREPDEDDFDEQAQLARADALAPRTAYHYECIRLLQNDFLQVPITFIRTVLNKESTLYKAYLVLEEAERTYLITDKANRKYQRVRGRTVKSLDTHPPARREAINRDMDGLQKELEAAKKKAQHEEAKRAQEEEKRLAEEMNEAHARATNSMTECGCCFTEFPTNRMTFCNGSEVHFFCYECAANYVKAEIGQGKCHPKCMDIGGCGANFSRSQLKAFLDNKTFEALEKFQQQEDLRLADMDDLEECPFCDFKMICQPKEVDREFRCMHDDCRIVSCRLCRMESHVPLTCEQAAKDRKVDARHQIEEAMTKALIRACNKCKNKFVKEAGCNKMTCPTCGNNQCYVCSKNVHNYDHFGESIGKCPLYDNTDKRHDDDVKKAEAAALEELKRNAPDISEEDLKVKVSDAVQRSEARRIERGQRVRGGIPVPGIPPIPPMPPVPPRIPRIVPGNAPYIPQFHNPGQQIGVPQNFGQPWQGQVMDNPFNHFFQGNPAYAGYFPHFIGYNPVQHVPPPVPLFQQPQAVPVAPAPAPAPALAAVPGQGPMRVPQAPARPRIHVPVPNRVPARPAAVLAHQRMPIAGAGIDLNQQLNAILPPHHFHPGAAPARVREFQHAHRPRRDHQPRQG